MKKVKVRNDQGVEETITVSDDYYALIRKIEDSFDEMLKTMRKWRSL